MQHPRRQINYSEFYVSVGLNPSPWSIARYTVKECVSREFMFGSETRKKREWHQYMHNDRKGSVFFLIYGVKPYMLSCIKENFERYIVRRRKRGGTEQVRSSGLMSPVFLCCTSAPLCCLPACPHLSRGCCALPANSCILCLMHLAIGPFEEVAANVLV